MSAAGRRAGWLWVIGSIAVIAALFGPEGRWGGVDIGATGAAVFTLSLAAAIWLFATQGDQVFPEHASVAERRAWVGIVFVAIALAVFLRELLVLAEHGAVPARFDELLSRRFVQRYLLLIVAWTVISHLIGRSAAGIPVDERDLRFQHVANRAADWALTLIVIAGIVVLASVPRELLGWWLAPIVLANVLVGVLIAKSLVEHVVLAFSYRRGGGAAPEQPSW